MIIRILKKISPRIEAVFQEADQSLLRKEKAYLQIKLYQLTLDNKFMKLSLKSTWPISRENLIKIREFPLSKLRKSLIDTQN